MFLTLFVNVRVVGSTRHRVAIGAPDGKLLAERHLLGFQPAQGYTPIERFRRSGW